MIIWSYKLERFDLMAEDGYTGVEAALNQLGEQGWELVGVHAIGDYSYAVCKRPVDVGEAAG
ncbi:MAG: hypothetical protein ABSC90_16020 [Acidimicrobiales bacterium]|jgi:hypothetical protein